MVVLFDFDEVFVDLNTGALKYINKALGTNYTMDDVTSWEFFDKPEIRGPFLEFLALPTVYQEHVIPNKKMINVLKQMVEMGKEVYIVTASVESSQDSKYKFIKEHMSFFDTKNLFTVNGTSKYKMKSDVLDELKLNYHEPIVLVDDGIHNVLDMMADIKHKDKLDGIMKQFYINRTLKKFNNPYHEFIYGIIPELSYNKEIEDGKRIFKLKETKNIWSILKGIEVQHKARVENKQAEIFNYLNNIFDDLVPTKRFKEMNELQNNVSFIIKSVLNKTNKHAHFLAEIAKLSVKNEEILKFLDSKNFDKFKSELTNPQISAVHEVVLKHMFEPADKKFGSEVMYNEIKNLSILHSVNNLSADQVQESQLVGENYFINERQHDLFSVSLLKTLIDISKENIVASRNLLQGVDNGNEYIKEKVNKVLKNSGMAYEVDFDDRVALYANLLMAFNKNFTLNSDKSLDVKDKGLEAIRQEFMTPVEEVKKVKSKKRKM